MFVNYLPAIDSLLTPRIYVDYAVSNSVDGSSLLRLDHHEKLKLDEQDSINLYSTVTTPKTKLEIPTKAHVDL